MTPELDPERSMVTGLPLSLVMLTVVFAVPPADTEIVAGFSDIEKPAAWVGTRLIVTNTEEISIVTRIADGLITIPSKQLNCRWTGVFKNVESLKSNCDDEGIRVNLNNSC